MPQGPQRIIHAPDGNTYRFPAEATDDQISDALKSILGTPGQVASSTTAKDLLTGAIKGVGDTFTSLGELVHKIPGVSEIVDAFYGTPGLSQHAFPAQHEALQPQNTAEAFGKGAEQIGEFFLPTPTKITKALTLGPTELRIAEAMKNVTLTKAQGGSDTSAGINAGLGVLLPYGVTGIADRVEGSANRSLIRAMGPAGGRGPTAAADYKAAEDIAPELNRALGSGIKGPMSTPLTQAQARKLAGGMVTRAGTVLDQALTAGGSGAVDTSAMLAKIAKMRQDLRVPRPGGAFLDAASESEDKLLTALEDSLRKVDPTAGGVQKLKEEWNKVVNWAKQDPAKGTEQAVYRAGGDVIRAQLAKDAPKIAEANRLFHLASQFDQIVNATNARRVGAGVADYIAPYARPAVGGAIGGYEGYQRGGVMGAIGGAVVGTKLGQLIQSPGFRYVSATAKQMLANALDKGDGKRVAELVTALTAQAQKLGAAKGGSE